MRDVCTDVCHDQAPVTESRPMSVADDNVDIVDTETEGADAFATYFAEAHKACDREVSQVGSHCTYPLLLSTHLSNRFSCLVALASFLI